MLRKGKIHNYTDEELFEIGYWSCAIFMAHDESFHSNYQWDDIAINDRAPVRDLLISFVDQARLIVKETDWEQMGIDFFFCRKGHGVDFRDRDYFSTAQKKALVDLSHDIGDDYKEIYEDEDTTQLRYG